MNKIFIPLSLIFLTMCGSISAQTRYFTKIGHVSFFSSAEVEDILAHNFKAYSLLDIQTGSIEFAMLMKAFEFEKALMQQHFNENYVESKKYPKAYFKGKIENIDSVNFFVDGEYNVMVKGDMTIHGVTKQLETECKFTVKWARVSGSAVFNLNVKDFNIQIPALMARNIAETIEVKVNVDHYEVKY